MEEEAREIATFCTGGCTMFFTYDMPAVSHSICHAM